METRERLLIYILHGIKLKVTLERKGNFINLYLLQLISCCITNEILKYIFILRLFV